MTSRILLMKALGIPFTGSSALARNTVSGAFTPGAKEFKWTRIVNSDMLRHSSRNYSVVASRCLAASHIFHPHSTHSSLPRSPFTLAQLFQIQNRCFSSQNDDGSDDASTPGPVTPPSLGGADDQNGSGPIIHSLPATMTVPETWPSVPVIAINRNPVFPRFIKIIEVIGML